MAQRNRNLAAALAASSVLVAGAAIGMTSANLPAERFQGSVAFLTGGIGQDEAAAMRTAEAQYPLSLEFIEHAQPRNEYLSDVSVTIRDRSGNDMLQAYTDGPFLLAKLPDGRYTVSATHAGKTETRHITVAANKPEQVVFSW
jgi:hypothetical protein